jgi:hypothetical protein
MVHRQALILGLCAGLLAGCATGRSVVSTSWLERRKPFQGPVGGDVVQVDVALLERPLGDRYLSDGVWSGADEQVVSLDQKAVLVANGFRVGQIGGITPAELQELLGSEKSCPNPRRIQLHAGNPVTLVVGPRTALSRFQLHLNQQSVPVELADAECILSVVPSLTDDGRTRLHFLPQLRHGEAAREARPAADRSGWVMQEEQPREQYAALGWEVAVAPNEYVIVGARADHPETLGHHCFIRAQESVPVQRLLVIRTSRSTAGVPNATAAEPQAEYTLLSKSPPLALTAALTALRVK